MKAALFTNEFPPEIYGGAGIHIQYLSKELRALCQIEARCFGPQNDEEDNLRAIGFSEKINNAPLSDIRVKKILKPLDINFSDK